MKKQWRDYQKDFDYACEIEFEDICQLLTFASFRSGTLPLDVSLAELLENAMQRCA